MEVLKNSQKNSKKKPKDLRMNRASESPRRVFGFGSFHVDETERRLVQDGKSVPMTPKVFDILLLLVQNSGSLITKGKLLNEIWPDACVEEANLAVNIASLRRALGDDASVQRYIETVPKRGYRFVATVRQTDVEAPTYCDTYPSAYVDRESENRSTAVLKSNFLAVLPFDNETNDPNVEYLSDGLTESLINRFSRLKQLRVVARNTVFRYKNTKLDPATIARQLRVGLVVSGRLRRLGDRVIITTELVDASKECQLWGDQFHGKLSDILKVQAEISGEIANALEFQLTREDFHRLTKQYTDNTEAYHLYLKGRHHWNKYSLTGLRAAIDYFSRAIEVDPTYALAYAGLADSYYRLSNVYAPTRDAMPKAKAAAMRALDIDPDLPEARSALGLVKLFYELDWPGAEKEFRRAIEINPNYSIAHQRLGLYLNLLGRFDAAENELELARKIDPLSTQLHGSFALMFFLARNYERALAEVQRTLEMDNDYVPTLYLLGRIYEQLGQLDQAIAVFERVLRLNDAPTFLAAMAHAQARSGNRTAARQGLNQLSRQSEQKYVSAYCQAIIHVSLGDQPLAFSCLEKAYDDRCEMMTWLKVDPALDSLRTDLRFTALMDKVGVGDTYYPQQMSAAS